MGETYQGCSCMGQGECDFCRDGESIAFKAGRSAYEQGVPLKDSALRNLRVESQQYDDFVNGYDSAKRKRKSK